MSLFTMRYDGFTNETHSVAKQIVNVLFSIKPVYAKKIYDGSKKYEYRKFQTTRTINYIYLYETYPINKVTGYVKVNGLLKMDPTELWEKTNQFVGIDYDEFFEYYKYKKYGFAYILGNVIKYDQPKELSDFGLKSAPQNYAYVDESIQDKETLF